MSPSSGVVAAVDPVDASGVDVGEPSAKWCFANSMAWAVPWAMLGMSICFGGATTVGIANKSSRFALMDESRRGTILEDRRPLLARVEVGESRLLMPSSCSAAIVDICRRMG
jgi:hypothetical protein